MNVAKWIAFIKGLIALIKTVLDTAPPAGAGAAAANGEALATLASVEAELAEIESAPEGAQAALGDRLKKVIALVKKLWEMFGGILNQEG